jgi:predicted GIY-YIG superfamily endonuclease/glycine/D-amino acid oxidase-like deaminating enzyme
MYAVYILLCSDNSYYTGLSNDLDKRLWQHETGFFPDCYTFKRRPVKLVWQTRVETAEEAGKLKKQIKGWSRKKKEALIKGDIEELKKLSNTKKDNTHKTLRQAQGLIDYLIVGQGICGTFLSWYLQKNNSGFLVIDNNANSTSSKIAAGIINPVTGRRMVKTWMIDELLPFCWQLYSEMGHELGITAISQKNIIDFFPNPQMMATFLRHVEESGPYCHAFPEQNHFNSFFNYDFGCGEIRPVYEVHLETILPAWKKILSENRQLIEEEFSIADFFISDGGVRYKNIKAKKIIFCNGVASTNNPWFNLLPFAPNKGEALILEIPGLPDNHIYKKGFTIAPLAEKNIFWAGSGYQWDFADANPSQQFYDIAIRQLKEWLKLPFKVLDHKAALRPATLERRPFVGFHPNYPQIGILNGMGTKGCSLAPFFAKQLTEHLLYGNSIQPEADVNRFLKILSRNFDK